MKAFIEFYNDLTSQEAFGIFFLFPLIFLLGLFVFIEVISWLLF